METAYGNCPRKLPIELPIGLLTCDVHAYHQLPQKLPLLGQILLHLPLYPLLPLAGPAFPQQPPPPFPFPGPLQQISVPHTCLLLVSAVLHETVILPPECLAP